MESQKGDPVKERRKGPDFRKRFLKGLGVLSWMLLLVIMAVLHMAKPEFETFFDRFYRLKLRTTWNLDLARQIYYLMLVGIGVSGSGLVMGLKRSRRKGDGSLTSFIFIGLFSIAGVVLYRVYFL